MRATRQLAQFFQTKLHLHRYVVSVKREAVSMLDVDWYVVVQ